MTDDSGTGSGQASGHRSLAAQLRSWSDDQLTRLLTERPDLATPAPHDFGQLASRATARNSIARALDLLTQGELSVLDAQVIAGQTTRSEVASMVAADEAYVDAALTRLVDLAVVWESPEGLRAVSGAADCLAGGQGAGVSGVRPRSSQAPASGEVERRLTALSPAARALLDHVVAGGGEATAGSARRGLRPDQAETPAEELIAHRLLTPGADERFVVPGEVGIALRGGRTTTAPVDVAPGLATTERPERMSTAVAVGSAAEFVRRCELLLEWWGTRPASNLRTGGLGVRELRAAAAHLQVGDAEAALLIETASAAGLVGSRADTDGNPAWVPTDAFDEWLGSDPATRWVVLARAWLTSPRLPGLVGSRDSDGKTWNALVPDLASPLMPEVKAMALGELADLPGGTALAAGTGLPSLVARVTWLRPRRPRTRAEQVGWAVDEAARIGLTGLDALAPYARPLIGGDLDAARGTLAALLPSPVDHVLIQADLTAVAPGPLEAGLARSMHLVADVESRGTATVYRFTPASLRRAFDAGWSTAEVHAFLASASRTPIPQPLSYLVDDAVRSFGRLRVGVAEAFVRSEDETALSELMHDPRAAALGLRRIAPTVVISTTPVDVLLPRLRDLGLAPVVEGPDGTVRVGRAVELRARTPHQRGTAPDTARQTVQVASAVHALRTGDEEARHRPASASTAGGALSALRDAIERRIPVTIGFTDNQGVVADRIVRPVAVEGGQLTAHDADADPTDVDAHRTYPVHRISTVTPLP